MEIFEAKKMTDETLGGVSSISQLNDDPHTILKPSLEEIVTVGDDLVSEVVTTKFVETTEVSVVKVIQDDKEDELMKDQEQGDGNEGVETEKEGVFGNLVGDDEGMNVNCSENGNDAGGINLVFEGNARVLADENARGDPMDVCLSVGNEKNNENGAKILESNDEHANKNDEENVENREDNGRKLRENEEELKGEQRENEEQDHDFVVGDFVWGKIKSHPWWPGQIYDPSDASDNAARLKHKGRILVAHFGDGSFSWCSPSQLKPFVEHFPEMLNQSDSKKFVNAVQMSLEQVSKLVEEGLMCKCQTVNRVEHGGVVNRGIKEGIRVPKGNMIKVLMDRIEPVELLSTLKGSATMDPGAGPADLQLALLKSCLNAFYSKKGGYLLMEYHDPECIEGLENDPSANPDINPPSESIDNGDDKLYQRRKRKSVAELLREEELPTIKKTKIPKDSGSGKRKRKVLVVSITPERDHEIDGVEEETMSPRQRKKSKYLSPPYLSPVGSGRLSVLGSSPGSGSFKEPKPKSENVPEMAAKHLEEDSSKKSSGKKTHRNKGARDGSDSQDEQKNTTGDAVNVNKVLHWLLHVALDPTSFIGKNLPVITDFFLSYRSSIFEEGSSHQTDQKKTSRGTSDLAFIRQKLESMIEIVKGCEETEMSADLKAGLAGGMQEVLQKVGNLKGK